MLKIVDCEKINKNAWLRLQNRLVFLGVLVFGVLLLMMMTILRYISTARAIDKDSPQYCIPDILFHFLMVTMFNQHLHH